MARLATIIGAVVALGLVSVSMAGATSPWRLSAVGLGPITVGMSPDQVEGVTGDILSDAGLCSELERGPSRVNFEFVGENSLGFIIVGEGAGVVTTKGVRAGDLTSKIFKVYGSAARRMKRYDDGQSQGPDVLYVPSSGPERGYRIVFWTYRKRIVLMAAGRKGVERADEFCA